MKLDRTWWIPLSVLALLVTGGYLAGAAMTSDARNWKDHRDRTPESRRYYQLKREVERLSGQMHMHALRDALINDMPSAPGVHAVRLGAVADTLWPAIRQNVNATRQTVEPRAAVGVLVVASLGEDAITFEWGARTYVVTDTVGAGKCAITRGASRASGFQRSSDHDLLGPCRMWARFGKPGEQIRRWLEGGGYNLAATETVHQYATGYGQRLFGVRSHWNRGRSTDAEACRAVREPVCARLFTQRTTHPILPPAPGVSALEWYSMNLTYREGAMLYDIQKQYGDERFARFWTSSADVETAFHESFGITVGEWLAAYVAEHEGVIHAGPRLSAASILLSLLTLGVLVGITVMVAQRRHVL